MKSLLCRDFFRPKLLRSGENRRKSSLIGIGQLLSWPGQLTLIFGTRH